MHRSQHAGDELVDTKALFHQRHQGRDSAFVVRGSSKVGKDQLLKRLDLILQGHEIGDGFVATKSVIAQYNTLTPRWDHRCSLD